MNPHVDELQVGWLIEEKSVTRAREAGFPDPTIAGTSYLTMSPMEAANAVQMANVNVFRVYRKLPEIDSELE